MKLDIFRFTFQSPLHLANERADYQSSFATVSADMLTAAVHEAWSQIGKPEWIEESLSPESLFVFTNAFPFKIDQGHYRYFFPRPLLPVTREDLPAELVKPLKKVKWLEKPYFEALINGETIPAISRDDARENHFSGHYLVEYPLEEHFYKTEQQARNYVPRKAMLSDGSEEKKEMDTTIFHVENLYFLPGAGLFNLAYFANEDIKEKVLKGLKYLQYNGIGTDKQLGHGRFTFEHNDFLLNESGEHNLKVPEKGQFFTNLSSFCPDPVGGLEWMSYSDTRYQLEWRSGFITSEGNQSYKKDSVYMFNHGSVFPDLSKWQKDLIGGSLPVWGKVNDLWPQSLAEQKVHPVYRSGRSLFLPVKNHD